MHTILCDVFIEDEVWRWYRHKSTEWSILNFTSTDTNQSIIQINKLTSVFLKFLSLSWILTGLIYLLPIKTGSYIYIYIYTSVIYIYIYNRIYIYVRGAEVSHSHKLNKSDEATFTDTSVSWCCEVTVNNLGFPSLWQQQDVRYSRQFKC